jgi:hypothetical protein
MVCISTVYRFTVFIYFNLEFSVIENQGQSRYERNVTSEVRILERLLLLYLPGYYLTNIIKFLQYHGSRFCATYHSSCSPQNILSTSYRRNTKIQIEQRFYRGFTRIDFSKLIYRLKIQHNSIHLT